MLRKIIIDTNNDTEGYWGKDLEMGAVKKQFSESNGHCITFRGTEGYISAADFAFLWFEEEFLSKYDSYPIYLSELLEAIAKVENIDWKIKESLK